MAPGKSKEGDADLKSETFSEEASSKEEGQESMVESMAGVQPEENEVGETEESEIQLDESEEAAVEESPPETPEEKISRLEKELDEKEKGLAQKTDEASDNYDQLLRMAAELDNYKKRSSREREEFINYANEELIKELLPVVDSCERAISSAKAAEETGGILEGLELIFKQLYSVLEKRGVTYIEAVDKPFDPNYHEAVMTVSGIDYQDNVVVEELQRGYTLRDRVIRPSMVKVAKSES